MDIPDVLKPLERELDYDRPQVLVVVGTGVSRGASGEARAGWRGLLEDGVEHLVSLGTWTRETGDANRTLIKNAFTQAPFDLDETLQRAESISKALGGAGSTRYADWLKSSVGTLKARAGHTQTLEKIRDLRAAGARILTTNYDDLLCDALGEPPVTWEDHEEFQRVVNDHQRPGVLHIHGHWSRPSSVILGSSSYARIVAEPNLQTAFRGLAMSWSWLYVGCGDGGLSDPNLGKLLRWAAAAFPSSKRDDYFLSDKATAAALATVPDLPPRLHSVSYTLHEELPQILHAITPAARHVPFEPLGPICACVRKPGTSPESVPFPSWEEFLAGDVPRLVVDEVVEQRLDAHDWAFVRDVASVGKTTLAIRQATRPDQRNHPAYYLDLKDIEKADAETPEETTQAEDALRRLARPGVLFILDNANRKPHLVQRLWTQWHQRRRGSRMLMLATVMQRAVAAPTDDALQMFELNKDNPPVSLRPTSDDLAGVFRHVVRRMPAKRSVAIPVPAPEALAAWHQLYGCDLASFAAAVTNEYGSILKPGWNQTIPPAAAAQWMETRHLKHFSPEDLENLICLAVFAGQEFELQVPMDGLPHPHPQRAIRLLQCDLVKLTEYGQNRRKVFSLREPGWGELVLGTCESPPDRWAIMLAAALRSPALCFGLMGRLRTAGYVAQTGSLWSRLEEPGAVELIALGLLELDFLGPLHLASAAAADRRLGIVSRIWNALEADGDRVVACALEMDQGNVAAFLNRARDQGRGKFANEVWNELTGHAGRLAEKALGEHLHNVIIFLRAAERHGQTGLLIAVWAALADRSGDLAAQALQTPLSGMVGFFRTAVEQQFLLGAAGRQRQSQMIRELWIAFTEGFETLIKAALNEQIGYVATFLDTAARQGQHELLRRMWNALADRSAEFAEQVWATSLGHVGAFFQHAVAQQEFLDSASLAKQTCLVGHIWNVLRESPAKLTERVFEEMLGHLVPFIETCVAHGQMELVEQVWKALASQPQHLAERAFEEKLGHLAPFIEACVAHGQLALVKQVSEVLVSQPQRLADMAFKENLGHLVPFFDTCAAHGLKELAGQVWKALASQPQRLAERAFEEKLGHLAPFIKTCAVHGQLALVGQLSEALASQPQRLAERAFEESLGHLAPFFETCASHGLQALVSQVWEALASQPQRLAERLFEVKLGGLVSFFEKGVEQGRLELVKQLWKALAAQPARLAERAFDEDLGFLVAFFKICVVQGQIELLKSLWASLAAEPELLADKVAKEPLHSVAAFAAKAREQSALLDEAGRVVQDQMIERLWTSMVKNPVSLTRRIQRTSTGNLSAFLRAAPDAIAQEAVRFLDSSNWAFSSSSTKFFNGGASLAVRFGELGREDLQLALLENLLLRSSWRDFADPEGGLFDAAVLLAHVPPNARNAVPGFLDALCTSKWLGTQYSPAKGGRLASRSSCGRLAGALRMLALHNPLAVLQRFHNLSLGIRLKKELLRFGTLAPEERQQVVQLLGTSHLIKSPGERSWLARLDLSEVARLPEEVLPHPHEATVVGEWQYNLWLGLRLIATQAYGPLVVDRATLARTLKLWRANLAASLPNPNSTEHRINQSMVNWLGKCVASGIGHLVPNHEPLWALIAGQVV